MKKLLLLVVVACGGCSTLAEMSPQEKRAAIGVAIAAAVVAGVAAHDHETDTQYVAVPVNVQCKGKC